MNKTALIIVDVQLGLFQRNKPLHAPEKLLKNINMLEEKARKKKSPITFIQHESSGFLKSDTPSWQLHPDLNYTPKDMYIRKKEGNSFFETPLNMELQSRQTDTVVICGLLSQLCVQRTCLGALELGYKTILASDAHSTMSVKPEKTRDKVHKVLEKAGAILMTTEEILF